MNIAGRAVVRTTGLDALLTHMGQIEAIIWIYANLIANRTRELAPVRTGADRDSIRDSIAVVLGEMAATVSIGEGLEGNYGALQELGFHHIGSGRFVQSPALIPAFLEYREAFLLAVRAVVRGG